jgi:hypothetical protein
MMNLANLCPIPIAWAPYFLDFKTPHETLQIRRVLMGMQTLVAVRNRAAPLLDLLQTTCVRLGPNPADHVHSVLDQGFEPTAPDAHVITCMQAKLAPYLKAGVSTPAPGVPGQVCRCHYQEGP